MESDLVEPTRRKTYTTFLPADPGITREIEVPARGFRRPARPVVTVENKEHPCAGGS